MPSFTKDEILKITEGRVVFGDSEGEFIGVSTDSRTVNVENLFVAIKGEKFDGHEFISQAIIKGAKGVLISSSEPLREKESFLNGIEEKPVIILVKDTLRAYQDIAKFHKERFSPICIAVTGSNGKSTTKEMIASVSATRFVTMKNRGNLNNHIGVPFTLFGLKREDQVAVIEMGMNHAGEIKRLCEIVKPEVGVITNIGTAHIGHLGSVENIKKAKGELIDSLDENGTAILNGDDPLALSLRESFKGKLLTFSIKESGDVRAVDIRKEGLGTSFKIETIDETFAVKLSMPGIHNIYNALAAAATGIALGISSEKICEGLEKTSFLPMRMEEFKVSNITIINDAYNANPDSMLAAIKTLSSSYSAKRKFFVAGDMFELGNESKEEHKKIGRHVSNEGIDYFFCCGKESRFAADEAIATGMNRDNVFYFASENEAIYELNKIVKSGDVVLIKGSRGMAMEKIAEGLISLRKAY